MRTIPLITARACRLLIGLTAFVMLFSPSLLAQKASFGQQVAVMKALRPDLKTIGVLGSVLTDKTIQDLTRAGLAQGVAVIIAKPKDPREVGALYKKLVAEKKIQMLWIPEPGDEIVSGVSIDYLTENTVMDKVGLCVTENKFVATGALCSTQSEGGKLVVHVNKRIATVLGVAIPGEGSGINFVSQ